jgi:hypothetical protein
MGVGAAVVFLLSLVATSAAAQSRPFACRIIDTNNAACPKATNCGPICPGRSGTEGLRWDGNDLVLTCLGKDSIRIKDYRLQEPRPHAYRDRNLDLHIEPRRCAS